MNRAVSTLAAAAAGVALAHAAPSVAFLRTLRYHAMPGFSGLGREDHVALTFDDGPSPRSTPLFLEILAKYGIKATFFVCGRELAKYPTLGQDIVNGGHEIAVHGWDHRCMLWRTPRATFRELARTRDLIEGVTGVRPRFFRAPYGVFSTASLIAARKLSLTPIVWTTWGFDWTSHCTPESVLATVTKNLDGGGTILLHDADEFGTRDAWQAALTALPALFSHCEAKNLTLGPLRDHGLR
jgi:peptidoglycan/xylan/chitin deacetylase (PgdA/CDA1 family)